MKIWKRGDKITVKDLNRFENNGKGIYNVSVNITGQDTEEDTTIFTATMQDTFENILNMHNNGYFVQLAIDTSSLAGSLQISYVPLFQIDNNNLLVFEKIVNTGVSGVYGDFYCTISNSNQLSLKMYSV